MEFVATKDAGLIPFVLSQILDTCVNGITLSDPDEEDNPIVYANEAFERITGYPQAEILARNCRFLQGEDRDQDGIETIRAAIRGKELATVTLRNYRKNGEMFVNQFTIRPLFDREGSLIYFLGLQHDITNQAQSEEELKRINQSLGQSDSRIHSEGRVLLSGPDQPVLGEASGVFLGQDTSDPAVRDRIRALMTEQPYAVLCTQGSGQPYGSIVAFAANEELNAVVFATPIATRKYRLLSECDRVALVVDNRAGSPRDLSRINAVTATGKAVRLSENSVAEAWQKHLIHKHPHMHDFICAPSTALFRIDIHRYLHVHRLQEVHQWIPPHPG